MSNNKYNDLIISNSELEYHKELYCSFPDGINGKYTLTTDEHLKDECSGYIASWTSSINIIYDGLEETCIVNINLISGRI